MEELKNLKEISEEKDKVFEESNELNKKRRKSFTHLLSNAINNSHKYFKYCNGDVAYGYLMGCLHELIAFNEGLDSAEQEIKKKVEEM